MREYRKTMIFTSIVILLPMLVGILLWDRLPDQMATHFGMDGTPNGWSGKATTVFGMPVFFLVIQWLGMTATIMDPKRKNMSEKLLKLILWFIPIISLSGIYVTYGYALGYNTSSVTWAYALLGIVFIVVGNYLPKCRQNYTMGIKLPWTLHDEENWNHTHRLAGYLWIVAGIIMLVNVFMQLEWLVVVVAMAAGIVPTIYSFLFYCKHKGNVED